jgi:hypothetical protein
MQRTVIELRRQLRALLRASGPTPAVSRATASQATKRVAAKKPRAAVRN